MQLFTRNGSLYYKKLIIAFAGVGVLSPTPLKATPVVQAPNYPAGIFPQEGERMNQVENAAENGTRLDVLIALRKKLAIAIDECKSMRDLAALIRQLQIVLTEIEKLSVENQNTSSVLEAVIAKHNNNRVRKNKAVR